jgi:hypothetical protein
VSYVDEVLADRPYGGFWLLNDVSGTVALNLALDDADGTYVGSPGLGGAALIGTGSAAQTTGASYVSVITNRSGLGSNYSVELWFEYVSGSAPIFRDNSSTSGIYLDLSGTHVVVGNFLGNNGLPLAFTATTTTSASLKTGRQHCVITGDGSRTRLYVAGALAESWSGSQSAFAYKFILGKDGLNSGHVEARYSALAIYWSTLSAARIAAHYAAADGYAVGVAGVTTTALPVAHHTPGQAQVTTTALPVAVSAPVFTVSRLYLNASTTDSTEQALDTPNPKTAPIHVVSPSVPTPTLVDGRPQ